MYTELFLTTLVRSAVAILLGALIGSERARHGRAAGMRTHILVALGACMTALTSIYVCEFVDIGGDPFRIPAQVISGIGFLGAGMIVLKQNNIIMGLTTAAGVWTTATIGIAVGYGYYIGAATVTALFLVTIILFSRFERKRKTTENIYLEIDDAHRLNDVLKLLSDYIGNDFETIVTQPKTNASGYVGISIKTNEHITAELATLAKLPNVVFVTED